MKNGGKMVHRGRPTGKEAGKIKAELQKYFNRGNSQTYTIDKTGHDRKTIMQYWKEFRQTYIEEIDENFVARQRAAREAALCGIDEDIEAANEEVECMKSIRNELNTIPAHGMYIKALEHRNFLIRKRAAMDMVPTVDVNIDKIIAEETIGQPRAGTDKRKD